MIYLNNAATTWPKPDGVYGAVEACLRAPASPSRTTSKEGRAADDLMDSSRREVADFLGISDPSRLVFLPGATYALNLAILGLPWEEGDVAIMGALEHHAVSRPIRKLARERGVRFQIAPYRPDLPIDLDFVERVLKSGRTRLVACTMASNVTGDIFPIGPVARLAHRYGALCLIDASQAAGVLPVDVRSLEPDLLAFPGHKALFGPPGVGGLYVARHVRLNTLAEGGTGKDSGKHELSGTLPSSFEVGTHNLPAIAGLAAGVRWLRDTGVDIVRDHERTLSRMLVERVSSIPGATLYGSRSGHHRTAVLSIHLEDWTPADLAGWLSEKHGLCTRAGFHCAPLAHETLGTLSQGGSVRLSPGFFNTPEEMEVVGAALHEASRFAAAASSA
ncbi:MAG: aminotransferase class V-fold PLP-dependent enzyme [Planctomycetes bacterium]|nr:aminotransferase class V-fold PLP-dependent enzyme [Planctomycetota bacterium]